MRFSKVLHLGRHQCRLGGEGMEKKPHREGLEGVGGWKVGRDLATRSLDSQPWCPGLRQKKRGQKVQGGDTSPLLS